MNNYKAELLCLYTIIIISFIAIGFVCVSSTRDDSDSLNTRSGLTVYVDAKTGCEYIGAKNTLIPRVDAKGNHLCMK